MYWSRNREHFSMGNYSKVSWIVYYWFDRILQTKLTMNIIMQNRSSISIRCALIFQIFRTDASSAENKELHFPPTCGRGCLYVKLHVIENACFISQNNMS